MCTQRLLLVKLINIVYYCLPFLASTMTSGVSKIQNKTKQLLFPIQQRIYQTSSARLYIKLISIILRRIFNYISIGSNMEKAMAPHSSIVAWKIPWTEEPGRLQSMGSLRVTTERLHFHFPLSCIGEGNGNPLQCSCLENPRDRGAWQAAVHGVTQSRTRLKRLSSSSSSSRLQQGTTKIESFTKLLCRVLTS